MKNDNTMKRARPLEIMTISTRLTMNLTPASILTTSVLFSSLLLSQTAAFSPRHRTAFAPRSSTVLEASRAATADSFAVQAVQPRRFTSMKERREAQEALARHRAPTKDTLVDAQMLELLSDQFLYPTKPKKTVRERPRGRPESVAGAMSYETMLKNRKEAEEQQGGLSTVIPYSSPPSVTPTLKKRGVRGTTKMVDEKTAKKQRKKVVKNLPEKNIVSEEEMAKQQAMKQRRYKTDKSVDLQKYYRTELLTAKEEYSLGMQVHFMMKCEEVHEGLAMKLMRLPTMEEWAIACG